MKTFYALTTLSQLREKVFWGLQLEFAWLARNHVAIQIVAPCNNVANKRLVLIMTLNSCLSFLRLNKLLDIVKMRCDCVKLFLLERKAHEILAPLFLIFLPLGLLEGFEILVVFHE